MFNCKNVFLVDFYEMLRFRKISCEEKRLILVISYVGFYVLTFFFIYLRFLNDAIALFQFSAKVVSCDKTVGGDIQKESDIKDVYEVILEDTILFPEGGGQVCIYIKR